MKLASLKQKFKARLMQIDKDFADLVNSESDEPQNRDKPNDQLSDDDDDDDDDDDACGKCLGCRAKKAFETGDIEDFIRSLKDDESIDSSKKASLFIRVISDMND